MLLLEVHGLCAINFQPAGRNPRQNARGETQAQELAPRSFPLRPRPSRTRGVFLFPLTQPSPKGRVTMVLIHFNFPPLPKGEGGGEGIFAVSVRLSLSWLPFLLPPRRPKNATPDTLLLLNN